MPDQSSDRNPFDLQPIGPEGPFVLGPTLCSPRRREYLQRSQSILGFYTTIAAYAVKGREWAELAVQQHNLNDQTPMRLSFDGFIMQTTYKNLKGFFERAGSQLTNQAFLMVYGNFEAFLLDTTADALRSLGQADPDDEAIDLVMRSRWRPKLDRLSSKLGVRLPKGQFVSRFSDLDMGFLGERCTDPIDFLDRMAAVRHRLVHSTGRVSEKLARDYPKSGLKPGDPIVLPFGLPYGIHFFFVKLSDLLDEQFSMTFGWNRLEVKPEHLVE